MLMKTNRHFPTACLALLVLAAGILTPADAQQDFQKRAQTGMKFLVTGLPARQTAVGEAFTAVDGGAASMFYNPAGMARLGSTVDLTFGRMQWIADINHIYGAIAFSPWSGDYGVIGVTFHYVDYGEIQSTIRYDNTDGYLDVGTIHPYAYDAGLTYARALSDKFSVGGTVKLVKQDLGTSILDVQRDSTGTVISGTPTSQIKNALDVVAYDFGILYRTGIKSLTFGMSIRNFSREVTYQRESFQLPLLFKMGLSMNVLDVWDINPDMQSLLVAVDADHPRDYPEQLRVGAEYVFAKTLSLRVGYVSPSDEHNIAYGVGLMQTVLGAHFALDYSYTPFGVFNNVQRLSFQFSY